MNTHLVFGVVIVLALVAIGFGLWLYFRNRSLKLQERFGPEYGRTVLQIGSRRRAENVLEERRVRVDRLSIHPLPATDKTRFESQWRDVQAQFVDDPRLSLTEADNLVSEVMNMRGYPLANFDQRAADISADHPVVVENYRAGHAIALRHRRGEASTEDMRQAMVHYRVLFQDLLGSNGIAPREVTR